MREPVITCVDKAKAQAVGYANRCMWAIFQADAVIAECVPKLPAGQKRGDSSWDYDDR